MGNGSRGQLEEFISEMTHVFLVLTDEKVDRFHSREQAGEIETLQVGQSPFSTTDLVSRGPTDQPLCPTHFLIS